MNILICNFPLVTIPGPAAKSLKRKLRAFFRKCALDEPIQLTPSLHMQDIRGLIVVCTGTTGSYRGCEIIVADGIATILSDFCYTYDIELSECRSMWIQ